MALSALVPWAAVAKLAPTAVAIAAAFVVLLKKVVGVPSRPLVLLAVTVCVAGGVGWAWSARTEERIRAAMRRRFFIRAYLRMP